MQRRPGCPGTRPHANTDQHDHAAYSDVYSTAGTSRRRGQHLHQPAPRRPPPLLYGWGERHKEGRPAGSTGLLQAAGEPGRWRGLSQPHGRLRWWGGNPMDPAHPRRGWGGRRGCKGAGKTYGCHCVWVTCPRSHHRRCLSRGSLEAGPDWSWLHGCKEREKENIRRQVHSAKTWCLQFRWTDQMSMWYWTALQHIHLVTEWNIEFGNNFYPRVWSWRSPTENQRVSLKLWAALPPEATVLKKEHHTLYHKNMLACSTGTPRWWKERVDNQHGSLESVC